ncbi:MAG: tRNA (adenosine(37)-N6)-threonylcarbamoyltransferase complex dimerization subunit type 1 TsaB [Anaerolineae bacterium]
MLLAIDTASHLAGIALYDENGVAAEHSWTSRAHHTVDLVPNIVTLLKQQGLTAADLTGLAVGLGPGSFTGLRIGLSVAKGFALAQNLPLVGVPSLYAIAYAHAAWPGPLWAMIAAGRGRFAGALFRPGESWPAPDDYRLARLDAMTPVPSTPTLYVGELGAPERAAIRELWGENACLLAPAATLRRVAYLAELGWQRLARGEGDDVAGLSPIYPPSPGVPSTLSAAAQE